MVKTGYRCQSFQEFVLALENIENISPATCRSWAMNFCLDNISLRYHDYFHTLIRHIKNKNDNMFYIDENYDFDIDSLDYTYSEEKVNKRILQIQNKIAQETG